VPSSARNARENADSDAQEVVDTVALAIRHDVTATELRNSI
jgi:hypothetical protein